MHQHSTEVLKHQLYTLPKSQPEVSLKNKPFVVQIFCAFSTDFQHGNGSLNCFLDLLEMEFKPILGYFSLQNLKLLKKKVASIRFEISPFLQPAHYRFSLMVK
jgi:hypothetical protein